MPGSSFLHQASLTSLFCIIIQALIAASSSRGNGLSPVAIDSNGDKGKKCGRRKRNREYCSQVSEAIDNGRTKRTIVPRSFLLDEQASDISLKKLKREKKPPVPSSSTRKV